MALPVATPSGTNAARASYKQWLLTAADGDSGEVLFNHGFVDVNGNGVAPGEILFEVTQPGFHIGGWYISTISATQIGITKSITGVGTGTGAGSLVLLVKRPHTSILS